ncbi:MAG: hypothetical protein MI748_02435 [Opitutales bacterium]|nr:hypothetical protein [Opitutales bacterium]
MKKILRIFAYILSIGFLLFGFLYAGLLSYLVTKEDIDVSYMGLPIYLSILFSISAGFAIFPRLGKKIRLAFTSISSLVFITVFTFSTIELLKAKNLPNAILKADSVIIQNFEFRINRELNKEERMELSKRLREIVPRTNLSKTVFKFFFGGSVCACLGHFRLTLNDGVKEHSVYFRHDEVLIGDFSVVHVDELKVVDAIKFLIGKDKIEDHNKTAVETRLTPRSTP